MAGGNVRPGYFPYGVRVPRGLYSSRTIPHTGPHTPLLFLLLVLLLLFIRIMVFMNSVHLVRMVVHVKDAKRFFDIRKKRNGFI
jgi:hypothetical protein